MGTCDFCQKPLSARRMTLERTVETISYQGEAKTMEGIVRQAQVNLISADQAAQFCGPTCADVGIPHYLSTHGIKILPPGVNPIETCAKCGGPVYMTEPHIAYSRLDETVASTTITVHEGEYLCVVCVHCGGIQNKASNQIRIDQNLERQTVNT
jgi:hypothetical protein